MRCVSLLASLAWLAGGCEPDVTHTAFLCATTADCPSDQQCRGGRCRRGALQHDGIACFAQHCEADEQCCVDDRGASCIAAGDACDGIGALCDGDEDCVSPDHCCVEGNILACNTSCDEIACQDSYEPTSGGGNGSGDCPAGRPACDHGDPTVPWGTCR